MAKLPFEIVFENDDFLAINKPSGMLVLPDRHDNSLSSVKGILEAAYGKIFVIHRIDRDTSGLVLFAKNAETHKYLSDLFQNRQIEKRYWGLVNGQLREESGSVMEPLSEHPVKKGTMIIHSKGKASHTDYKVLQSYPKYSLVEYHLHTGRTHQIRVHSKFVGNAIVCDPIYGDGKPVLISSLKKKFNLSKNELEERPILGRLGLHAYSLKFEDQHGIKHLLKADIFKDMRALLQQLEKNKKD